MTDLFTGENLIAFLTLTSLEIVLGIDNIVFIAIQTSRLPAAQQPLARKIGLLLAMLTRIGLLFSLKWILGLTEPIFEIPVLHRPVSGRDLILIGGGLFLLTKATLEIHHKLEAASSKEASAIKKISFTSAVVQIMLIDIVFSLDSVITAVGMAKDLRVMISAVVASIIIMMIFAESVSRFVEHNPTVKMLALSFLLLIGMMLTVEGCGEHVNKGYIYFAMGFSLFVEMLNLRLRGGPSSTAPHA